jgi:hypothetical protein
MRQHTLPARLTVEKLLFDPFFDFVDQIRNLKNTDTIKIGLSTGHPE